MDNLTSLISNVGFPIAVSWYILLKMAPAVEDLRKAVNKLNSTLEKIGAKVDSCANIVDHCETNIDNRKAS